jgi:hypothetical protein
MRHVLSSKLEPTHSEETNLKKIINSRIEEVRKSSGIHNLQPGHHVPKRPTIIHAEVTTAISIPSLTTSREISQYGAFKKSIASVSTNNQSIRMPVRREPISMRRRLLVAPQNDNLQLVPDMPYDPQPQPKLPEPSILLPKNIDVSLEPEDYSEKVKKFDNLAASSHATEYVQEEIEVSAAL